MNAAALRDKLDDLLNPIVVKELRQAVKSRIVMAALTLFLVIQLSILLFSLSLSERRAMDSTTLHAGNEIFRVLQGILLGTCMLLIPLYAGVRLSSEHSETNVDLLFISTLRPRGIIAGKLQASIVLILLIFSACAPFMTFTYLLRGIDIPSIVLVLFFDFLIVLFSTQAAIFLGSIPANAGLKLFLGLTGFGLLVALFSTTLTASIGFIQFGMGSRLDTLEFWLVVGGTALVILASIGLFFVWSVAIVSAPSVNRALPVRLYFFGFWLVTGVLAAVLAYRLRLPIPIYLWMDILTALLCMQILVSINEREQWGFRVTRTIPRWRWLRVPAFLLYSGSAGGILFALMLLVLTLALSSFALAYLDRHFYSALGRMLREIDYHNSLTMIQIALYAFDYCMLAVWVRNVFLYKHIKAAYTWVVALLLCALGFSLPYPLLYLFNSEDWRFGRISPWWQISNPLATLYHCLEYRGSEVDEFRMGTIFFLSVWALVLLLACFPWFLRQMRRFHPPLTLSAGKP
jgi:hypothetical protein